MDKEFYWRTKVITPQQAVTLYEMNIDQSKTLLFWGLVRQGDRQGWALFLTYDGRALPLYLCGDEVAEAIKREGTDLNSLVETFYAAFDLSQLMQILQNEIMNMSLTSDDKVNMSYCPRDYEYFELAEGCANFLIGLIRSEQYNDDLVNGALEIYANPQ